VAEDTFTKVDERIRSGEYTRCEGKDYYQCNLFTTDVAKDYFGVELPKMKDAIYGHVAGEYTAGEVGRGVLKRDWPNKPMPAAEMYSYFKERSGLRGSGVSRVVAEEARKKATRGELVLMLGGGHATVVAPSENPWPLVFRSDLSNRGDDNRTRVGMASPDAGKFFAINPEEYENFTKLVRSSGMEEKDIFSPFLLDADGKYAGGNDNYDWLHREFAKGSGGGN